MVAATYFTFGPLVWLWCWIVKINSWNDTSYLFLKQFRWCVKVFLIQLKADSNSYHEEYLKRTRPLLPLQQHCRKSVDESVCHATSRAGDSTRSFVTPDAGITSTGFAAKMFRLQVSFSSVIRANYYSKLDRLPNETYFKNGVAYWIFVI